MYRDKYYETINHHMIRKSLHSNSYGLLYQMAYSESFQEGDREGSQQVHLLKDNLRT